jgi:excisionase family DNA binding protein
MPVTDPTPLDFATLPPLLDVGTVASMLSCSVRHVYRLADGGKMPRPTKLGALVRWNKKTLEEWLAAGCPSCRNGGR